MFGLSFGELCVLLVVAMIVLGPKDLPRYLRKAGEWAGRLRRLAYEMREKSGIDEVLRTEGIDREIAEIRKLARGELTGVVSAVRSVSEPGRGAEAASPYVPAPQPTGSSVTINQEREYPREGPDSYGALSDMAVVYEGSLAPSPLAQDNLYTSGNPPVETSLTPATSRPDCPSTTGT